jgi:hypothetical protein
MTFTKFLLGILLAAVFLLISLGTLTLAIYLINLAFTLGNLLVIPLLLCYLIFIYFFIYLINKLTL